ncbi:formylglycine-generating enzyme family protein [Myxosarcina sp. GI1]|uniref:formylglycine-generating enzyme family protein n=1 Tax=Myxosarcina sp. GI1 TaxID=1541065 RepID=UPI000569560B|nr:formylglycine-generating enzyme family protein [Myxosarcina sp. GI1]
MKRRNFFKLTSYGGAGLTTAVCGSRALATAPSSNLNLPSFDFATIKIDRQGQIEQQTYHQANLYTESLGNYQTLAMVAIPEGKFLMGSSTKEKFSSDRERPQHQVRVPKFLLGKYSVTQAQWRTVANLPQVKRQLNPNPSHFQGDRLPVECVSWLDAVEFCDRLTQYTGKPYRLPSEAEWEYACRANTQTPFSYGDTVTGNLADYASTFAYASETGIPYRHQTTEVGSFMPNAFGLYDLHGNVREWCADVWHENYRGAPSNGKAWATGGKSECRILRGGSWANKPSHCRSAHRSGYPADSLNRAIGFRVAMNI